MLKTLLVDDDYLVRSYLKTLPAWAASGFEIITDVRDGEEALKVLDELDIDLIVTDISMPLMDGIELIRKVRSIDKKIYIIALSCHDDFEYVKEAMKLGADEYVLKNTLKDNTLRSILLQAREKIQKQQTEITEASQDKRPRLLSDDSEFLFFNKALSEGTGDQETEELRQNIGIPFSFYHCAVVSIVMESAGENEEQWFDLDMEQYFRKFRNRLYDALKKSPDRTEFTGEVVYLGMGTFCCFLDLSEECKSSVMRQRLIQTAASCFRICRNEPYSFRLGASDVCMGAKSLRQAYQQSREALKTGFYEEKQILYYDSDRKVSRELPENARKLLRQAESLMYKRGKEPFLIACLDVCKIFEEERTSGKLVVQWLHTLEELLGKDKHEHRPIRNHQQVYEVLNQLLEEEMEDCQTVIPAHVSEAVRVAAMFARQHYHEHIGLSEAAEAAGVNASYLSYLFSQEMGVGFSGFLLNQRIGQAKKLLAKTSLSVKEISVKSGFNDCQYFSKTFKKQTGVSPANYRQNASEKKPS